MLLFYEVLTRATRRLYLSYPALDESAQPLSPSPFLQEVEQACGPGRVERTELTDLSPVPRGDEPLSPAEFRLKAVSSALEGEVALLAGLMQWRQPPGLAENIVAGLQVTHLRGNRDAFGPAEGMLRSDDARNRLSNRFSLQKTFSATDLEQYAACPFRFFLQRVLQLEPVEELALAADPLQRGRLAHDVLALFHRRVNQALGHPGSPLEPDGAERDRLLSEALAECFESERSQGILAGLREVDRRLLAQWLAGYGDQYQRYLTHWPELDAPPVPEFFEVSFGRPLEDEDPPSTGQPLELQASGRTVRIAGRVDRVDTGQVAGKPVFNVIDYKTGSSIRLDAEAIAAGTALQLPLYAFAVAELVLIDRNPVPWQAGYWYLRGDGFKPGQALRMYRRGDAGVVPDPQWETIRWSLPETVVALVEGIRRGEFPVHGADERCTGYCPYRTICRVNQVRSLEKTWRPEPIQD